MKRLKIALLAGGPSRERGISLNSARSVMDHLHGEAVEIVPVYFDTGNQAHAVSRAQLYSNTPDDFEFKLAELGRPLSQPELIEHLRGCDLVFPAIHGAYGEGGALQKLLEEAGLPAIGSPAAACELAFDKYEAGRFLAQNGYFTLPALLVEEAGLADAPERVAAFVSEHGLERLVVKPARSGSSIGVHVAATVEEAVTALERVFADQLDDRAVVEPFCSGSELTLIVLENDEDEPVALLPTEIEIDDGGADMFDYRKKYLPTRQVTYRMPPRYDDATVARIRRRAEELFRLFGLRDFARFDGWVLEGGEIWFSDFNLVSGMEQNSFLFLQAAQLGMSHADLLRYLVRHAGRRHGLEIDLAPPATEAERQPIYVLFGGSTSERHVSLMSGTNVWLKLLGSRRYAPRPFLLDPDGGVWSLPYAMTLRHTVEEVVDACRQALAAEERLRRFRGAILERLAPPPELVSYPGRAAKDFVPEKLSLDEFIAGAPRVFIALHGGIGENGELQARLAAAGVPFTGSDAAAARCMMDKYATGEALAGLEGEGIRVARKRLAQTDALVALLDEPGTANGGAPALEDFWHQLTAHLESASVVVKPNDDGCSSGVARLLSPADLAAYLEHTERRAPRIPPGVLGAQHGIIEMPTERSSTLLFETFIETDELSVVGSDLRWERRTGLVEVTVGVLGRRGELRALTPSVTVAAGKVLSLEEKFQGGTGINVTPPPEPWVSPQSVAACRRRIARVAEILGISGFARIDAFLSIDDGEILVIEANSIPGLTPSTVIFHQALHEEPALYPREFLEEIVRAAEKSG